MLTGVIAFMSGEKIQALRNENKMSQEKLAELLGVSRQAVSKWEIGLSNPTTENLIRLAEIFQVSMDEIAKPETTVNVKINMFALLVNISIIGYTAIMVSSAGLYGYYFPYQDAFLYPWIVCAMFGAGLIGFKNFKIYRSNKIFLWDIPFAFVVYILPNILLGYGMSNSRSILLTLNVGLLYTFLIVNATFHPWEIEKKSFHLVVWLLMATLLFMIWWGTR
jgi:transcriptional regulator with XRE-family HTH domain